MEIAMLRQMAPSPSPTIFVRENEFDELDRIASGRSHAAALLRAELQRAIVLSEGEAAPPFVRLGASVEYLELPSGRTRRVRLVRPQDADIDQGALSVLTHVGAALLGLTPGDSFSLTMENGRQRVLVVTHVEDAA